MTNAPHSGWQAILDEGERILWQGQPDGSIHLGAGNIALLLFGAVFAGFSLFWMVMASMAGGFFWMFGLIHFSVGVGLMVGAVYWKPFVLRRSFYTLTDRRAFIARDLPVKGRSLDSYPITAETQVNWVQGKLPTIHFAQLEKRGKNGPYMVDIGFERIPEGEVVYQLIRKIQTEGRVDAAAPSE